MTQIDILATPLLALTLVLLARIDLKERRLPDPVTLPLILSGLVLALWRDPASISTHVIGAVVAYAIFALIGHIYFSKRGVEGLGLGDAKLFAAAGAWLGWESLPLVLLIASSAGLAQALLLPTSRFGNIAFGPWLAAGFFLAWVLWTWEPMLTQ